MHEFALKIKFIITINNFKIINCRLVLLVINDKNNYLIVNISV